MATCYGILGEPDLAGKFLMEAARHGWDDFQQILNNSNLINVWEYEIFQEYLQQVDDFITEQNRLKGDISYIEVPMQIRYRTVLPNNFHPSIEYTIKIMMHGFGGNHNNFRGHTRILQESNVIYVAPQAPYPFETFIAAEPSFSWGVFDSDNESYRDRAFELTGQYIIRLAEKLRTIYKVESIYLAGFSQGGFNTLDIGIRNPNVFDGLICYGAGMFPGMIPDDILAAGNSVPVLLVHGESDFVVNHELSAGAYNRLMEAGFDVTLHSFDGAHTIPRAEFEKAIRWIYNR
jgi:predicted esterase